LKLEARIRGSAEKDAAEPLADRNLRRRKKSPRRRSG